MRFSPALVCAVILGTVSAVSAQVVKKSSKAVPSTKNKQERLDYLHKEIERRWHEPENKETGDYPVLVEMLREIVRMDPKDVDSWSNLWYLLWSMGFKNDALEELKRGLSFNRDSYYMYDEIGEYYVVACKDFNAAAHWFEQAIKYKDCKQSTFDSLGTCYEKIGNLDRARRVWEAAVKRWPNDEYAKRKLLQLRRRRTDA